MAFLGRGFKGGFLAVPVTGSVVAVPATLTLNGGAAVYSAAYNLPALPAAASAAAVAPITGSAVPATVVAVPAVALADVNLVPEYVQVTRVLAGPAFGILAPVTPTVGVTPLPVTKYFFSPPVVVESVSGVGPLWGRWGKIQRGISVLKFGTRYVQYRMPSEDDIATADVAYIGGRQYEVSSSEHSSLEAAGYTLTAQTVPYSPPVPGNFGGHQDPIPQPASVTELPAASGSLAVAVPPWVEVLPATTPSSVTGTVVRAARAVVTLLAVAPDVGSAGTAPAHWAAATLWAVPPSVGNQQTYNAVAAGSTLKPVAPTVTVGAPSGAYTPAYPPSWGGSPGGFGSSFGTEYGVN